MVRGTRFYGLVHNPRGESLKKVGLLTGPNPTANLVSVIWEGRWSLCDKKIDVYKFIRHGLV